MNKKAPTNLQREKIHRKDCDMLSNVGIPSAQKDESYCTCVKTPTNPPTETVSDENTFTQPSGEKCRCRKGPFHYATKREREYIPKSTRAWGGTWVCENCGGYKYDM